MDALISIVIPIFNQELYLDRSLNSVIEQSYTKLEIILVNDGSTDKSLSIMREFQKKDARIKIINQENGGLIAAVTAGVKLATGDYICFVDPDDYVSTDYIKTFIENIGDNDVIACGFYRDACGNITESKLSGNQTIDKKQLADLRDNILFDRNSMLVSNVVFISRWNKMYRRDCVEKIINRYCSCKNISLGEDTIFTYLVLLNCNSIITLERPNGYYYNIRSSTSMMSNGTVTSHLDKAKESFYVFDAVLKETGGNSNNALYLYYFLIETLFQRCKTNKQNRKEFCELYQMLHLDRIYLNALDLVISSSNGRKKISFCMRKYIKSPHLFLMF